MKLKQATMLAIVGLTLANVAVRAHHAFATEFDVERPMELTGVVSEVELINPHSWIHIDVTGDDGTVETWMIEGGSPNALYRRGITADSVPVGAELYAFGYQARDGGLRIVGRTITFSDGRELFFSGTAIPDNVE